jgi:hypothetical protein
MRRANQSAKHMILNGLRPHDAVMDDEFARDVEEAIKIHRQPWTPPAWDQRD